MGVGDIRSVIILDFNETIQINVYQGYLGFT